MKKSGIGLGYILIEQKPFSNSSFLSLLHLCFRHLLTSQPQNHSSRSINDVMPMIGVRFYNQLDAMQGTNDILERELAKVRSTISLYCITLYSIL